jgi:hypothetical protein
VRTEQETGNREQNRKKEFRKASRRIRIEANLPVLYRLREDGTGNKE